jgi:hypothetical protein
MDIDDDDDRPTDPGGALPPPPRTPEPEPTLPVPQAPARRRPDVGRWASVFVRITLAVWVVTQHFGVAQRNPVDASFGDRATYHEVAAAPLTSLDFWAGVRPMVWPALLAAFGLTDPAPGPIELAAAFERLTLVQEALSAAAWLFLATVLSTWLTRPLAQVFAFASVLAVWVTRDVGGWNRVVLSESLSLTTFALAAGLGVVAIRVVEGPPRPLARAAAALALLGALALFAGTRDASAWVLPPLALVAVVAAARSRAGRGVYGLVAMGSVAIFLLCQASAGHGGRYREALMNVISVRVVSDPGARAWWVAHGMPDDTVTASLRGQQALLTEWHGDPEWEAFVGGPGRRVYATWLALHPFDTLGAPLREAGTVVGEHSCTYFQKRDIPWVRAVEQVAWPWGAGLWAFWAVGLGCAVAAWRDPSVRSRAGWGLLLLGLVYPLALLTWHGDAFEHTRHFVLTNVMSRVVLWFLLALGLERLLRALDGRRAGSARGLPPPARTA